MIKKILYVTFGVFITLSTGVFLVFQGVETYASAPGFMTDKMAHDFYIAKPSCLGISLTIVTRKHIPDSGQESVCIGFLQRKVR